LYDTNLYIKGSKYTKYIFMPDPVEEPKGPKPVAQTTSEEPVPTPQPEEEDEGEEEKQN
jgi:hypothetical protein